jgi:hypothetical protein
MEYKWSEAFGKWLESNGLAMGNSSLRSWRPFFQRSFGFYRGNRSVCIYGELDGEIFGEVFIKWNPGFRLRSQFATSKTHGPVGKSRGQAANPRRSGRQSSKKERQPPEPDLVVLNGHQSSSRQILPALSQHLQEKIREKKKVPVFKI